MSREARIDIYKQIEAHRRRPLLVYVTSKREGASGFMASDALPCIIEQIDALPKNTRRLDFLIASLGGDPMTAWRIMSLIRQRVKNVSVLIPQSAYSAATLLAFGGDEIVIHPNGHLGPVDMQMTIPNELGRIKHFSTEDITTFLDFVRDTLKLTDQEHVRMLFEGVCKEIGSLGIGFSARSSKLAVDLGERLLALHMKDDDSRSKLRTLVENMSRKFQSHSYPVNRSEAKDIGLPVSGRDTKLEDLMWKAWLDLEQDMQERVPFDPIHELMKSAVAQQLLTNVLQLTLPPNAPGPSYFSAVMDDIRNATIQIPPVDFQINQGFIESSRIAHSCRTRGKILSCRTPDLMIQFNAITEFRGWVKEPSQTV